MEEQTSLHFLWKASQLYVSKCPALSSNLNSQLCEISFENEIPLAKSVEKKLCYLCKTPFVESKTCRTRVLSLRGISKKKRKLIKKVVGNQNRDGKSKTKMKNVLKISCLRCQKVNYLECTTEELRRDLVNKFKVTASNNEKVKKEKKLKQLLKQERKKNLLESSESVLAKHLLSLK
jgi:RNase P subunit RPR2